MQQISTIKAIILQLYHKTLKIALNFTKYGKVLKTFSIFNKLFMLLNSFWLFLAPIRPIPVDVAVFMN